MSQQHEIVIGGFGGQGIILAGYILGQAASIFDKKNATLTRDYGPEARGGACRAQVIISDSPISYPHIESPSALVIMSQEAYTRYAAGLRQGAPLLIDEDLVKPDKSISGKIFAIPATRIAQELGKTAIANMVMVGFLTAITNVVPAEAMRKAILDSAPKGTEELNLKAFERGYSYGLERLKATESK